MRCRFLRVIIMSSFREEARRQKQVVGVQHDLAVLFAEASQNVTGAPSNARLARLFRDAAPRKKKTNVWARLRGQQEQLTIKVDLLATCMRIFRLCPDELDRVHCPFCTERQHAGRHVKLCSCSMHFDGDLDDSWWGLAAMQQTCTHSQDLVKAMWQGAYGCLVK